MQSILRVILNVCLLAGPGVSVVVAAGDDPVFTHLDPERTGITFSNEVSRETVTSFANLMPGGVAAGDVDGDGLVDLYFCSVDGPNALYRNLGEWKFEDITEVAGLACPGQRSIGACFGDLDGDGDLDLIVTARGTANRLFVNDGKAGFREDEDFVGRSSRAASSTVAIADVDGDGDLDLYVCNHRAHSIADEVRDPATDPWLQSELKSISEGKKPSAEFSEQFYLADGEWQEQGDRDDFLLNDGKGKFVRAGVDRFSMTEGESPAALRGWALTAQFRDFTGDGAPDLYVCNDFHTKDRLWINDGGGRFILAPVTAQRKMSWFSMVVDFADIDRDGAMDFFVSDMLSRDHSRRKRQMGGMVTSSPQSQPFNAQPQAMQNTLFRNRGDGSFAEISAFAGLRASEWTWGAIFMDADLDGYADLLVSTGMIHDQMDADVSEKLLASDPTPEEVKANRVNFPPIKTRNLLFRNRGDLRFEEVGAGFGLGREEISGGMVIADLDNDNDFDLVISNTGAPPEIYRNDGKAPRIAVRLRGEAPNTVGIGARVILRGKQANQRNEVIAGGRLSSGSDTLLVFATPEGEGPWSLEVRWRGGRVSRLQEVKPGALLVIEEATALEEEPMVLKKVEPLFEDASAALDHRHVENDFDDFAVQALLPNRMSRSGPGVSWIDFDGDGDDDVLVGAAAGGRLGIFENQGGGEFKVRSDISNSIRMTVDATSIVGHGPLGDEGLIIVGLSAWENPKLSAGAQAFQIRDGKWRAGPAFSGIKDAVGPISLADVDGDGDLDIFLGGRVRVGRYPEAADSRLIFNQAAGGESRSFDVSVLEGIGLVSGSVFADIDGDGDQDLVLAREWGTPAILLNTGSGLVDVSNEWGLSMRSGWWNGVAAGDFDGDGRCDLVLSNWGQNSKYEGAYGERDPLRVYYGDFDENGTFDIVEAHSDRASGKLVPERGLSCSSHSMPFVRTITPTFTLFGNADLSDIYGERLQAAEVHEARELRHMVLLNRISDGLEPHGDELGGNFIVRFADFSA